MDCLFCKIVKGEIPSAKVYEDNEVIAFLDIHPVNPGHTLIIPKAHYANLLVTPKELLSTMMSLVPSIAQAIMQATKSDGFNLGVNNGRVAGQLIDHTHLHIMPRHNQDGYTLWHGQPYETPESMNALADTIRKSM